MAKANITQTLVLGGKGIQPNDYARGYYAGTQPINVRAASTSNVALDSLVIGSALDDVVLALGDFVLLKNQADSTQNGIYRVTNVGAVIDAISAQRFTEKSVQLIFVFAGTDNGNTWWMNKTYDVAFDGSNFAPALNFELVIGAGTGGAAVDVSFSPVDGVYATNVQQAVSVLNGEMVVQYETMVDVLPNHALYLAADGRVGRASCNSEAEAQFIGFAVNGALTGQVVSIRKAGNVINAAWAFDISKPLGNVWLSSVAGEVTQAAPTTLQYGTVVGNVLSGDTLAIAPVYTGLKK